MADTTNDIWNDNDGEEDEAPRKGGRLRRFGIFFLVLAAVLGVVLVAFLTASESLPPSSMTYVASSSSISCTSCAAGTVTVMSFVPV